MNSKNSARSRSRSRSRSRLHWYPAWVYDVREDITRANMDRYDALFEAASARCYELRPDYSDLHPREQFEVWKQAREDVGLN